MSALPYDVDTDARQLVPITRIHVTGRNDRKTFDPDKLADLRRSIDVDGLAQPVLVRAVRGRLELVCGERRLRAHLLDPPRTHIEATIRTMSDEQASRLMLSENVHREDLDPVEEAVGYAVRMEEFGLTASQVAEWANVTTARVATRLPLMRLCPEAQDAVSKRTMPVNVGMLLAKLDDNRQRLALGAYVRESLTYFECHRLCERLFDQQQAEAESPLDLDNPLCIQTMTRQAQAAARRLTRKELIQLIDDLAVHAGPLPAHLAARVAAARK